MKISRHVEIYRALLCALVLLGAAGVPLPARAQTPSLSEIIRGGEGCAEAKRQAWAGRDGEGLTRASKASANIDVTWYSLDIDLDFDSLEVWGTVRVDARVIDAPLSVLVLDLSDSMTVTEVRENGITPVPFTHVDDALSVALSQPVAAGMTVSVEIDYGGRPQPTGFGAFVFGERFNVPYAWSLSEPYGAREWWPCKDHPSDKADSVRVAITVPDDMFAASQGLLRSTTTGGGRATYEWASIYPITSYLVSVAASRYVAYADTYTRPAALAAEFGPLSLPIEHYKYDDGTPELPDGWRDVTDTFEVLEGWYGPYPFGAEKYGHAEFTFGGGMEHQTLSSMGSSATSIVTHELAHQWYGDSVSPAAWPHLWLNEGFATHAEFLYWEAREDSFPGAHAASVASRRRFARFAEGTLLLSDTSSVGVMFDGTNVYAKGGIVVRMLRSVVGDSTFREIMRAHAADPRARYGTATTAQFQNVAEAQYGQPLDWFFSQWVTTGTGYPEYTIAAERSESGGGYDLSVTLEQIQGAPESNVSCFVMPVTIAVATDLGRELFTVTNDKRRQIYRFHVDGRPTGVELDPDGWLLRNDDVIATVTTAPTAPVFLTIVPNPTNGDSRLRVNFPDGGDATVTWYDVAGRRIREQRFAGLPRGPQDIVVSSTGLSSGVYFVRVANGVTAGTRKLVIVR